MDLYCDKANCLCHHLCPTGHFIYPERDELTGCSYVPYIDRHVTASELKQLLENEQQIDNFKNEFVLHSCHRRCGLSRSGGLVRIKIVNEQFYPIN